MAGEITLTFTNTETHQPAVLVGREATLEMKLLNRTDADVAVMVSAKSGTSLADRRAALAALASRV